MGLRTVIAGWISLLVALIPAAATAADGAAVTVEAYVATGEPFGVARMVVPLAAPGEDDLPRDSQAFLAGLRLRAADGRAHYPVFAPTIERRTDRWFLREQGLSDDEIREMASPGGVTDGVVVCFLFRGGTEKPLELTLIDGRGGTGGPRTVTVTPSQDAEAYAKIRRFWWASMALAARRAAWEDACGQQASNYVLAMLARRMGLEMPTIHTWSPGLGDFEEVLGVLLGTESVRLAMQKDMLLGDAAAAGKADRPLPKAMLPEAVTIPAMEGEIEIEPIASRVPEECFYIRCGSFGNFRWLRQFIDRWGTDTRGLGTARGVDYGIRQRLETQLALQETILAKLLGDSLIEDVAVIGTDGFCREGAALGIIFQARPEMTELLGENLDRQRRKMMAAAAGATERTVVVGEREISLISTPDNVVRSFHVADGDYHLVTTSRTLGRRFLEAAAGTGSLGAAAEFRFARGKMPLSRGDRAFVYLSDAFFRNLLSPAYRLEMTRRMRAEARIELVHLARLAAAGEGSPARTVEALIAGGFLPADFADAPDGGKVVEGPDGGLLDSLRGRRGSFLPVPDVEISGCTAAEVKGYEDFERQYRNAWRRMDPVIVGLQQAMTDDGATERITADLYLAPYAPRHYDEVQNILAPADRVVIARPAANLLTAQVNVSTAAVTGLIGGSGPADQLGGLARALTPPLRIYGGLADMDIPFAVRHGELKPTVKDEQLLASLPGYVGATPPLLAMSLLGPMAGQADAEGYANIDRFWMRVAQGFITVAPTKPTLQAVTHELKLTNGDRRAQVRVGLGDLSASKLARAGHAAAYLQARKVSAGNATFLDSLIQSFNVDPADAMAAATDVLAATLTCPMGGAYRLEDGPAGIWISSAWDTATMHEIHSVPERYRFDLLDSVKGAEIEFSLDPPAQSLTSHLQLELKAK